ncbi:hypothetical protein ES708_20332 [subsurface metagenome]
MFLDNRENKPVLTVFFLVEYVLGLVEFLACILEVGVCDYVDVVVLPPVAFEYQCRYWD